jgi:SET domain-containing protein
MQKFKVKRGVNGLGLFTNVSWKKGDKLVEYIGEIITVEEADRRGGKYLFEIDNKRTIDGKSRSNVARYINHSCVPNCETEIDGKRVFVHAIKKIVPGEELTYDYGKEYFNEYIKPKGCRCPKHALKHVIKKPKN